jgi:hypothetical protein
MCCSGEHDVTCGSGASARAAEFCFIRLAYSVYVVKAAIYHNRRERPRALAVNKLSFSYIIFQHQIENICNGIFIN